MTTPTLGVASATSLAVTGSSAPANGIYLPTANNVGIAANSALQLNVQGTASAVNYLNVTGSIASNAAGPTISAVGSDGSIPITIATKGNSNLFVTPGTAALRINGTYVAAGSVAMIISSDSGNGNSGALQFMVTPSGSGTNYAAARMHAENTNNSPTIDGGSWNLWTADQDVSHTMVKRIKVDNLGILSAGYNVTTNALYFKATGSSSAVNYMQVAGTATGVAARITATGSDTNVDFTAQTQGTGKFNFQTNLGTTQVQILDTASAVNYLSLTGDTTSGGGVKIAAAGSDTNIHMRYSTKGTHYHRFYNGNFGAEIFRMTGDASAANYIETYARTAGNTPQIYTAGTDSNIAFLIASKGSGAVEFWGHSARQFQILPTLNAVNYIRAYGAATGTAPEFLMVGTDADIDFKLTTKGTGVLQFGTHTATADTAVSGYITIKDSAGNTRKLAVIT